MTNKEYEPKILRSIALNDKARDAQTQAIEQCEEQGIALDKSVEVPDYSEQEDHVLHNIAGMSNANETKREAAVSELGTRE
jgi:hypothetical protein